MSGFKLFEQFLDVIALQDFVDKFDLTDKDGYDSDLKKSIVDVINSYKNGNSVEDIQKEFPNLEEIIANANKAYNEEMIRLALPQGDLQSSSPDLPKVNINWGKE